MSHFVGPKPPCWQCLLVSQVALIKKLEERTCEFIILRKEINVLWFFEFLIQFLTKTSDFWLNLLLLRRAFVEWQFTVTGNTLQNCYSIMNAERQIFSQILWLSGVLSN